MPEDKELPYIIDMTNYHTSSHSTKIKINVNKNSRVHYMVTKKGTPKPNFEELMNPNIRNESEDRPSFMEIFGSKFVDIKDDTSNYIFNEI